MSREMWVLFQYSSVYGAPTTPVGVLGIEPQDDTMAVHVEWLQEEPGEIWPGRLSATSSQDLPAMLLIWQHDVEAMASPADDPTAAPDLATAVARHSAQLAATA